MLLGGALIKLPLLLRIDPWLALIPIALRGALGWALQVPQNNEVMKAREAQGDANLAVALNESALYLGSAIGASVGGLALAMQVPVDMLSGGVALVGMGVQVWLLRQTNAGGIVCPRLLGGSTPLFSPGPCEYVFHTDSQSKTIA